MDDFLSFLGLYRCDVANDESCLFRAGSEQLFGTQVHHKELEDTILKFMQDHEEIFKPRMSEDVSQHVRKIKSSEIWSGAPEMYALSVFYGLYFRIFREVGHPPDKIGCPGSKNEVLLVGYSYNRFDLIHTKKHIAIHAVAQSIVYEVLYKRTFSLGEDVDLAVYKMLHDKEYSKKRRLQQHVQACERSLDDSIVEEHDEIVDNEEDPSVFIRQALSKGMPPFPYKVAKSLDPNISRNTEYDVWNEERKCKLDEFVTPALAPGVKCVVHKDDSEAFIGYIQEMLADGKVTVYMEELCEKWTVDENQLQAVPIPAYQAMMHNFVRPFRFHGEWGRIDFGKTKKKGFRKHFKSDAERGNIDESLVRENSLDDSGIMTTKKTCNNKSFNSSFSKYKGSPECENRRGNRNRAFYDGNAAYSPGTKPKLPHSPVSKRSAPIPVPAPLRNINHARNYAPENMPQFVPVNQYRTQEFSPEAYPHAFPVLTYTPGEETYEPTAATGAIPKGLSVPYSYPENASHLQFVDASYQSAPPDSNAVSSVQFSSYFYQSEQPCVVYNCEPPTEPITGVSSFCMNTPPPRSGISLSYMPYMSPAYGTPLPMTAVPMYHQCPPTIINSMGSFPHPLTPPHTPSAAPCHFQEVAHPQYVQSFTQLTPGPFFYSACADSTMTIPAGPVPAPYQPDQPMM